MREAKTWNAAGQSTSSIFFNFDILEESFLYIFVLNANNYTIQACLVLVDTTILQMSNATFH